VPRYYGGPAAGPPSRLVYLLDHEYTPRALAADCAARLRARLARPQRAPGD
jgi:hypothetical protein